jgi:nucleoside-diphosphate-sugar epimerase
MSGRILVVGGQGALGHAVLMLGCRRGQPVRTLVRTPRAGFFPEQVEVMQGDVADTEGVVKALRDCRALMFCVNVPITSWVERMPKLLASALEACRQTGARLVFPGNVWIYGPGPKDALIDEQRPSSPTSRKGQLRVQLEAQLRSYARHAIVRLPEFFGPNVANALMGRPFIDALRGARPVWLGGQLDVTVEYVFIRDAAHAMLALADSDLDAVTFHVAGSGHITPRAFLTQLMQSAGVAGQPRALPNWLLRTASLVDAEARALNGRALLGSRPRCWLCRRRLRLRPSRLHRFMSSRARSRSLSPRPRRNRQSLRPRSLSKPLNRHPSPSSLRSTFAML